MSPGALQAQKGFCQCNGHWLRVVVVLPVQTHRPVLQSTSCYSEKRERKPSDQVTMSAWTSRSMRCLSSILQQRRLLSSILQQRRLSLRKAVDRRCADLPFDTMPISTASTRPILPRRTICERQRQPGLSCSDTLSALDGPGIRHVSIANHDNMMFGSCCMV